MSIERHVDEARIRVLKDRSPRRGDYVLYWMQQAQRADDNHALEYSVYQANLLGLGVVVVFALTDSFPEANLRHYRFMVEGLAETRRDLARRGIPLLVLHGEVPRVVTTAAGRAAMVVTDKAYLRVPRAWRRELASAVECRVVEVETDLVVPVEIASDKREYAARTIRPKIHRRLGDFLSAPPRIEPARRLDGPPEGLPAGLDLHDIAGLLDGLHLDRSVSPVSVHLRGGASEARRRLNGFLAEKLARYSVNSNKPETDDTTSLSAYLHFGQISPLRIALDAEEAGRQDPGVRDQVQDLLEQLIVRRELAFNYCYYEQDYDAYDALPHWARATLGDHASDERPVIYSEEDLEAARTHDDYWNAAMKEMMVTGRMHNYMRMYWGKKILQWSPNPREAFERTLRLNNRYFVDGRDPNSFVGVAWVFGLHDRPWTEREIFGTVRIMLASGLERKCDIASYVRRIREIAGD